MTPVRLVRGKVISAIDGIVDTWDWFINKISGVTGTGAATVSHTDSGINIDVQIPDDDDDDDDGLDDLDVPEIPPVDLGPILELLENIKEYIPGDHTNIVFTPVEGTNKVKVDVYYK